MSSNLEMTFAFFTNDVNVEEFGSHQTLIITYKQVHMTAVEDAMTAVEDTYTLPEWEGRRKEHSARVAFWSYVVCQAQTRDDFFLVAPCMDCGINTGNWCESCAELGFSSSLRPASAWLGSPSVSAVRTCRVLTAAIKHQLGLPVLRTCGLCSCREHGALTCTVAQVRNVIKRRRNVDATANSDC